MQITICGGGNAAHTSVGLLAAQEEHRVNVYLSIADEAERWQKGVASQGGMIVQRQEGSLKGLPEKISIDPGEVIPGSQLVLLSLPAFAHESVLGEIAPFLEPGTLVGALAARGSYDLCTRDILKAKADSVTVFGLQTLPWACRIQKYGRQVEILGIKAMVDFATCPPEQADDLAQFLSLQLGIPLSPMGSFLSLTLAGTGQLIHPGVMFGLFSNWDGSPFDEEPLFYQGIDTHTAEVLQKLSDEVQAIRAAFEATYPQVDLSAVRTLADWLCHSYADDIADTTTLQTYFVTNRSYAGLKVPMRPMNGGLAPDFQARYLSEDVPFALLATRGIAELAGVATPTMDEVITWAQELLSKEYLVDGKLTGRDVIHSRAPQRYGFNELDGMINAMFCQT
jgi:hypothetical protein